MRRSNWKSKILVIAAFVLGVIAGVIVAIVMPENYERYRGLAAFGTIVLVSGLIVFVSTKCFHIGEE